MSDRPVVTTVSEHGVLIGVSVWASDRDEAVFVSRGDILNLYVELNQVVDEHGLDEEWDRTSREGQQ